MMDKFEEEEFEDIIDDSTLKFELKQGLITLKGYKHKRALMKLDCELEKGDITLQGYEKKKQKLMNDVDDTPASKEALSLVGQLSSVHSTLNTLYGKGKGRGKQKTNTAQNIVQQVPVSVACLPEDLISIPKSKHYLHEAGMVKCCLLSSSDTHAIVKSKLHSLFDGPVDILTVTTSGDLFETKENQDGAAIIKMIGKKCLYVRKSINKDSPSNSDRPGTSGVHITSASTATAKDSPSNSDRPGTSGMHITSASTATAKVSPLPKLINPKEIEVHVEKMSSSEHEKDDECDSKFEDIYVHMCCQESESYQPSTDPAIDDDPATQFHRKLVAGEIFLDINLLVWHWYLWRKSQDQHLPTKIGHFFVLDKEMCNSYNEFRKIDHVTAPAMSDDYILFPDWKVLRDFLEYRLGRISYAYAYKKRFLIVWKNHMDAFCNSLNLTPTAAD